MNYEVAIKPYLKGAENVTVVAIKMEEKWNFTVTILKTMKLHSFKQY